MFDLGRVLVNEGTPAPRAPTMSLTSGLWPGDSIAAGTDCVLAYPKLSHTVPAALQSELDHCLIVVPLFAQS